MDERTWQAKVHGITKESDTTEYTQPSTVRREHLSCDLNFHVQNHPDTVESSMEGTVLITPSVPSRHSVIMSTMGLSYVVLLYLAYKVTVDESRVPQLRLHPSLAHWTLLASSRASLLQSYPPPTHRQVFHYFWLFPSSIGTRHYQFSSVWLSHSVTGQSLTLCDPMDGSTPGLPVHRQLPDLAQTHVHRVSDAIQPSHLLSSPSPPAFNVSQHQGLFQRVSFSHHEAKVLEFQLQHQSFQ